SAFKVSLSCVSLVAAFSFPRRTPTNYVSNQTMPDDLACANILVFGKVQGVFFRASTMEQAQSLNLSGWVKNLPDGQSIEILAEGSRDSLQALVDWCNHGPPEASVEDVKVRWKNYQDEFKTFTIHR